MDSAIPYLVAVITLTTSGALAPPKSREPQFPLKTERMICSDEDIAQARHNIATYPAAKALADNVIKAADAWLEWDDAELRKLIPTADVPRAFNVGTAGCPECGKRIYQKAGTYPWVIDLRQQFKITCPNCKAQFPSNDFKAYYESGMEDKSLLQGDYPDDGWGWVGPDGHRYWLVAYANHWTLHSHIVPAIGKLGWAYLYTGDTRYAHKAAVLLDRVAEVYPGMDYHHQSRYGQLRAADGGVYPGKLVNCIWATGNLTSMAGCYDAVWETIDGDTALQELTGRTGEQIRANIEANLLEEGIDAIFAEKVRGNFGMHQRALVYATLARQHGKTDEWLETIFSRTGCSSLFTGLNYALYNLVYRDGLPYETSPGYNSGWARTITKFGEALKRTDYDVYAIPKTKRLYDGILDMINAGRFTPSVGDSSSVYGGLITNAACYQAAYRAYGDERYRVHLTGQGAVGDNTFKTYESLFLAPIEPTEAVEGPARPRLLDGYGMAILNNPADTVSLSLYYGYLGGHGHFDRLHFEYFVDDQPIMPDLGYPDFMNGYVPGIYSWSKNTISHNTVTVDATRQSGNQAGTVQLFAESPFARVIDVDAPETYGQCSTYRRHLVMVDVDADRSYLVDFFDVKGGSQHDYSLHGPPQGRSEAVGGSWQQQEKGTLAGEDVELAALYDDPVRGAEGFKGTYYSYTGSGFQHFFNVQRHLEGDWLLECAHRKNSGAKLRLRVLAQPDTELILADAQVSPVKHKELVKYIIARRTGENLTSRYAAVAEPFTGAPYISDVQRIESGRATAVVVKRDGGVTDIVVFNPGRTQVALAEFNLKTDALSAAVTVDADGAPLRVFFADGTALSVGERQLTAPQSLDADVVAVEPQLQKIRIRLTNRPDGFDPAALVGLPVHFENERRRTAHPIAAAAWDGDDLVLTTRDDLLVGRANITAVEAQAIRTNTSFLFAPIYRGTYATDAAFTASYPVTTVSGPGKESEGAIGLVEPLPAEHPFKEGTDAWIVNVGPGDRLDVPVVFSWSREG
jgi:Heparinase II/III-like protein